MSRFTKIYILPILLITVLCIAAVEGFYHFGEKYLQSLYDQKPEPSSSVSVADREKIVKDFKKPINYSIITGRNLFASRKGSDIKGSEEDVSQTVEMSSMDVVLMGTISGAGDGQRAIIYDKKDKKQELFQVGDYIQQAIIKQILRGKVILNLNGKNEMLDISEARNVKIARVAKVKPVVQTRKVIGRPVGQQTNNGSTPPGNGTRVITGNQANNGSSPLGNGNGVTTGVQPNNGTRQPKQLRTYRGGVIVKDKQVTQ